MDRELNENQPAKPRKKRLIVLIVVAALVMFAVVFCFCFVGCLIGKKFGGLFREKAEIFGGCVLVFIGLKIFLEDMFGL